MNETTHPGLADPDSLSDLVLPEPALNDGDLERLVHGGKYGRRKLVCQDKYRQSGAAEPRQRLAYIDKSHTTCQLGLVSVIEKTFSRGYREPVPRRPTKLDQNAFARNLDALFRVLQKRSPNLTAREFAADIGVGEDKISKWRRGQAPVPGVPTLVKLAARLDVLVDVLLRDVAPFDLSRAEGAHQPAHTKKISDGTTPVLQHGVQDPTHPIVTGGSGTHVEVDLSTEEQAEHAREIAAIYTIDRRWRQELYDAAATVRRIADHLGDLPKPRAPRGGRPDRGTHDPHLQRPTARRRGGRR